MFYIYIKNKNKQRKKGEKTIFLIHGFKTKQHQRKKHTTFLTPLPLPLLFLHTNFVARMK